MPLASGGVPRQQSRKRDSSVPHGTWAKEPQPRESCGFTSLLPAFDVQALVLGKSSARAFVGGHCQGQAVQEEAALSLGVGEGARDLGVECFPVTVPVYS